MGSYGIGVSRALAALAEVTHDDKGLAWPASVAPFDVDVIVAGKGTDLEDAARVLAEDLDASGLNVVLDDRRSASAGVKFKDSELLGIPLSVVIGRGLKDGVVELRERRSGERQEVKVEAAFMAVTAARNALVAAENAGLSALEGK